MDLDVRRLAIDDANAAEAARHGVTDEEIVQVWRNEPVFLHKRTSVMLNREDFEPTDEPLRVTLPEDRGISVSIDLTEAETDLLLSFARARGLGIAQTARDLLIEAMRRGPTPASFQGDAHVRR